MGMPENSREITPRTTTIHCYSVSAWPDYETLNPKPIV